MYSYSSEPSWVMVDDSNGNHVWINLKMIDYVSENNPGWSMVSINGEKLLVKIDFDKFGNILAGGEAK